MSYIFHALSEERFEDNPTSNATPPTHIFQTSSALEKSRALIAALDMKEEQDDWGDDWD